MPSSEAFTAGLQRLGLALYPLLFTWFLRSVQGGAEVGARHTGHLAEHAAAGLPDYLQGATLQPLAWGNLEQTSTLCALDGESSKCRASVMHQRGHQEE